MRTAFVGKYTLGSRVIFLYVVDDWGGSFDSHGDDGTSMIKIGISSDNWGDVVSVAIHEAMEVAFIDLGLRYVGNPDYSASSDRYHFHMNHPQFGEACARAGYFLSSCLPDLAKVYRKFKAKPKSMLSWTQEKEFKK